jgi:hypothetical protein
MITKMISPAILFLPSLEAYFLHKGKEYMKSRRISFLPGPVMNVVGGRDTWYKVEWKQVEREGDKMKEVKIMVLCLM